ncbi:unnamed protein product [Diplocarpon coronariae]
MMNNATVLELTLKQEQRCLEEVLEGWQDSDSWKAEPEGHFMESSQQAATILPGYTNNFVIINTDSMSVPKMPPYLPFLTPTPTPTLPPMNGQSEGSSGQTSQTEVVCLGLIPLLFCILLILYLYRACRGKKGEGKALNETLEGGEHGMEEKKNEKKEGKKDDTKKSGRKWWGWPSKTTDKPTVEAMVEVLGLVCLAEVGNVALMLGTGCPDYNITHKSQSPVSRFADMPGNITSEEETDTEHSEHQITTVTKVVPGSGPSTGSHA